MRGMWTSAIKQELWRTLGVDKKSAADGKASIEKHNACIRSANAARYWSSSSLIEIRSLLDIFRVSHPTQEAQCAANQSSHGGPHPQERRCNDKGLDWRLYCGRVMPCFGIVDAILLNNRC